MSVRDDVAAAFKTASEAPADGVAADVAVPDAESTSAVADGTGSAVATADDGDGAARTEPADTRVRAPDGKFTKADPKQSATKAPAAVAAAKTVAPVVDPKAAAVTAPPVPGATTETFKAPQSWKPSAREHWSKLPPDVQAEVARREQEVAQTLQGVAESKKVHQQFREVTGPYEALMSQPPMQVIKGLLHTAATLKTGTPQSKAQAVAAIIAEYGVDIPALDSALSGTPAPQQQGQPQNMDPRAIAQQVEQQIMQRMQQQRQQANVQQAAQSVEQFKAKAEFLDDVGADVAAIIESATQAGKTMTLQDAYDRACWANPEIRAVIQQREAAKNAASAQAAAAKARAAGSSVRNSSAISPAGASKSNSTREDVEAAIAAARNRA